MEALTLQLIDITGLNRWQETGFAPLRTAELTTMPADQTAINVAHSKMIILLDMGETWQVLGPMDLIAVSHLDGRLVTGFALELAVECIIMLAGQNALSAKCQGTLVVQIERRNFSRLVISLIFHNIFILQATFRLALPTLSSKTDHG